MTEFIYIKEEILDLIKKVKRQNYATAKYLEENIKIDGNGNVMFLGSKEKMKEILSKIKVKN